MDGAAHVANFLVAHEQLVALLRQFTRIIGQVQTAQRLCHLPVGADARDHFLPDVAALGVADGPRLQARFRREIGFIHLRPETRTAGFHARRLQSVPAGHASAELFCSGDQFVGQRGEGIGGSKEIKARGAEARLVHAIHLAQRFILDTSPVELPSGRSEVQPQPLNDRPGLRTLHAQQSVGRRSIHDLHVVGDDKFVETVSDGSTQPRLEIEQDFIGQDVDVQVGLELALVRDECGVAALTDGQILDVVGDLSVEQAHAVRAREHEPAAKAQVEHAGGLAQRGVFGLPVAIIRDRLHPVDFGEAGVELRVKFVQSQCRHGRRLNPNSRILNLLSRLHQRPARRKSATKALAGCSTSARGVATCCTTPSFMTTIRWPSVIASV